MDETPVIRSRSPFWWARYVPATLAVLILLGLMLAIGGPVLVPLLLSFALAFMLEPLTDWFQRRRFSRHASVMLAMTVATLAVAVLLLVLLPNAWHQLEPLIDRLPHAIRAAGERIQVSLASLQERMHPVAYERLQAALRGLQEDPSAITTRVGEWLTQGLFGLVNLGSAAIGLLIVPFFVYYLLLDMHNIRVAIDEHIPERHRGVGAKLFDEIADIVRGYVRGRVLVAAGMSLFYALGLSVLQVPLWAAIGIVAGFVGIIPYLGVITGLVLALAFAALDGAGAGRLLGVAVVFTLAQLLEDYVLTPKLIGDRLELHPMLVFIALIIAGDLFGLLGLVLAIPVLGVLKVLIRFLDQLYLRSDFYLVPAPAAGASVVQRAAAATTSDAAVARDTQRFKERREEPPPPPQGSSRKRSRR